MAAVVLVGLAQGTHPAVVVPLAALLFSAGCRSNRDAALRSAASRCRAHRRYRDHARR